jgi:integrase
MTKGSKAMVKANFKYVRESAPGYFYTRKKGYDPIRVHYIDADGEKVFSTRDQPEEFARAHKYTLALLDTPAPGKSEALPGSFAALVEEYKGSPEYRTKKPKTKKSYIASLNRIVEYWGHLSVEGLKRVNILRRRDALSDTPRTADQFVTMTSTLINFGMDRGYRESNPAQRVKKINIPTPYEPWPAEAIDRIIADGNARVADAVMVLLYTGQRESDAVKMRRGDIKNGKIRVVQEKTGKSLWVPLHPRLQAHIRSRKVSGLGPILVNLRGQQWTVDGLRGAIASERERLGLLDHMPHGLRKNAVIALLEAGCIVPETASITGQSHQMVEHYAKEVNQSRLADSAMGKWAKADAGEKSV